MYRIRVNMHLNMQHLRRQPRSNPHSRAHFKWYFHFSVSVDSKEPDTDINQLETVQHSIYTSQLYVYMLRWNTVTKLTVDCSVFAVISPIETCLIHFVNVFFEAILFMLSNPCNKRGQMLLQLELLLSFPFKLSKKLCLMNPFYSFKVQPKNRSKLVKRIGLLVSRV